MSQLPPASQVLSLPSITSMSMGARAGSRDPCPRPRLAQHQEQDAKPAFKTVLPTSMERFFLLHEGATSAVAVWLSFIPRCGQDGTGGVPPRWPQQPQPRAAPPGPMAASTPAPATSGSPYFQPRTPSTRLQGSGTGGSGAAPTGRPRVEPIGRAQPAAPRAQQPPPRGGEHSPGVVVFAPHVYSLVHVAV